MRLSDLAVGRENNLNFLRLFAASLVLVGHNYALLNLPDPLKNIFKVSTGPHISLAHISVDAFFVISGFLVCGSLFKKSDAIDFFSARFLRIYPGLIMMSLLSVLVLGPAVTNLPLLDYLTDRQTWTYLISTGTVASTALQFSLPGVFENIPYPNVVNGSLWTMPYEIRMYIILAGGYFFIKIITKNFEVYAGYFIVGLAGVGLFLYIWSALQVIPRLHASRFIWFFFSGSCFWLLRKYVYINMRAVFVIILLFGLTLLAGNKYFFIFYVLVFGYIVISMAYLPNKIFRALNKVGDYSFGIYIYAFPVQQACIFFVPEISFIKLLFLSFMITISLAMMSWHFVEKPFLESKNRVSNTLK